MIPVVLRTPVAAPRASVAASLLFCALGAALALLTLSACDSGETEPPETNEAPDAAAGVDTSAGIVGETLTFAGSQSNDPDGRITGYQWDFGDGTEATGETVEHTYTSADDYEATLTVTDDEGKRDTDNVSVTVSEKAPEMVTVTTRTEDKSGNILDDGLITYDDKQVGDDGTAEKDFEKADTDLAISAEADDRVSQDTTVTLTDSHEITLVLPEDTPESVSVEYRPVDADGDVLAEASVRTTSDISGTGNFTTPHPYGTDAETATGTLSGYEDGSADFTPDRDLTGSDAVVIELAEKTRSVTVEASSLEDDMALSSQIELLVADSVYTTGESPLTAEVPESVDELTASAAEHEQDKELYADTSATFAAEDAPVTLSQRRVLHCVNGLDNDGDGLVGVWTDEDENDIPTEGDSGDPGCTSESDESEKHRVFIRTSSGAGFRDTSFVSSHPDNWESSSASSDFPEHITLAVGNIFLSSDVKISSAEDGESFTWRFSFGANTNIAEIAEDDPSVDGWYSPEILGIKPSWFSDSTDGEMTVLHKAFVNDNPGDGNDDVIFGHPERWGETVTSWVYEPDHPALSGSSQPQAVSAQTGKHSEVETAVRSTGYVRGPGDR